MTSDLPPVGKKNPLPNLRRCNACKVVWEDGESQPCSCPGEPRYLCGARKRKQDALCKIEVSKGNRCYRHGGRSPRGLAHPGLTTGRYASLPDRYTEAFRKSLGDPKQLSLVDAVALHDARVDELLGRLDTGESTKRWKDVRQLALAGLQALEEGNSAVAERLFTRLAEISADGLSDDDTWQAIEEVLKHRRESVDVEVRRLKSEQGSVSAETVMILAMGLVDLTRTAIESAVRAGISIGSGSAEADIAQLSQAHHAALANQIRKLTAGQRG